MRPGGTLARSRNEHGPVMIRHSHLFVERVRAARRVGDGHGDVEDTRAAELVLGALGPLNDVDRASVIPIPRERVRGTIEWVAAAVHLEADVLAVLAVAVHRRAAGGLAVPAEVDVLLGHLWTTADHCADMNGEGGGDRRGSLRVRDADTDRVIARHAEGEGRRRAGRRAGVAIAERPVVAGDSATRRV